MALDESKSIFESAMTQLTGMDGCNEAEISEYAFYYTPYYIGHPAS